MNKTWKDTIKPLNMYNISNSRHFSSHRTRGKRTTLVLSFITTFQMLTCRFLSVEILGYPLKERTLKHIPLRYFLACMPPYLTFVQDEYWYYHSAQKMFCPRWFPQRCHIVYCISDHNTWHRIISKGEVRHLYIKRKTIGKGEINTKIYFIWNTKITL